MARERGFTVDVDGFEKLMEAATRTGPRGTEEKETDRTRSTEYDNVTEFVGYDLLEVEARLLETVENRCRTGNSAFSTNHLSMRRWADRLAIAGDNSSWMTGRSP